MALLQAMGDSDQIPAGYRVLDAAALAERLAADSACARHLGGAASDWNVGEVGDGNLNQVFVVTGPDGGLAVKQALPYLRLVGESWPLPLSRAHYENMALVQQAKLVPRLVPAVLCYDSELAMIAMELLRPHIIMRQGMIKGITYPRFVDDIAEFMAETLFRSSDLHLPAGTKRRMAGDFAGNTELCRITENVIFTEPYMSHPNNRWTAPYLDATAQRFREDIKLKLAVSRLKLKFLASAEALLHGDLHTGSIMVTEDDTRIIDPEFAFFGPMGFDIGAVIANLLLSYYSQTGHEAAPGERDSYRIWILDCVAGVWRGFSDRFLALWRTQGNGDAYPQALFEGQAGAQALEAERGTYMNRLWADTVGFAAAKMIRRILGIAHNIDFEWIKDEQVRAQCEWRSLQLARDMMLKPESFPVPETLASAAREHQQHPAPF